MLRSLPFVLFSLVSLFAGATAPAQCDYQWLPGAPANGPLGTVRAVLLLPNGDLVVGGDFEVADGIAANNIARWDGANWHPIGGGCNGEVFALARMPNGDLIAAGAFTMAGGVSANCVARWNGSTWQPLGTGVDSSVWCLQVLPNGDLVAGGAFQNAGPTYVRCIARWDGVSWSAFDPTFRFYAVRALTLMANGDLVAGCDDVEGSGAVRWTGTAWQALPGLDSFGNDVAELARLPNGDLVLGGSVRIGGTSYKMAIFDGVSMQPQSPPATPRGLVVASNGDIVVGGNVTSGASAWRGSGTTWTPLPGGPVQVDVLALDASGNVLAGGKAETSGGVGALARLGVGIWTTLGATRPPIVNASVRMANGDVVVGGDFTSIGGVAANNLARWNGSTWQPLGAGVDGAVRCLAAAANGDLVVGGSFTSAGGAPAAHVARWNGQAWTTLGAGLTPEPTHIAVAPDGRVLAVPLSAVLGPMEWTGSTWIPVPVTVSSTLVRRVVALPNSDFVLAGLFTPVGQPAGGLLRYRNGVATPFPATGAGLLVLDALVDRNGDLVVSAGGLRRWDGSTWNVLLPGAVPSFTELPDGSFLGYGTSVGTSTQSSLYRITPNALEPLGEVRGQVQTVAVSATGDLIVGGGITSLLGSGVHMAGDVVSVGLAQAKPSCPAQVTSVGAGCVGSAGPVTLAATSAPWTGAPFTMVASGMTANSLAVQLIGVQPLVVPLPGGAPGCSVFVDPVFAEAFVPNGGSATTTWVVPDSVTFAGLAVRAQVLGLEFGPLGIDRLTSTNALRCVIGSL